MKHPQHKLSLCKPSLLARAATATTVAEISAFETSVVKHPPACELFPHHQCFQSEINKGQISSGIREGRQFPKGNCN